MAGAATLPLVIRVLDLQSRQAAAGPVARIPSLRDNALQPERTRVAENGLAIALQVVAETQRLVRASVKP
jgi:hypothetical protein